MAVGAYDHEVGGEPVGLIPDDLAHGAPAAFEQADLNHGPVPVEMSRDLNLRLRLATSAVPFRVNKENGCACGGSDEWRRFSHCAGRLARVARGDQDVSDPIGGLAPGWHNVNVPATLEEDASKEIAPLLHVISTINGSPRTGRNRELRTPFDGRSSRSAINTLDLIPDREARQALYQALFAYVSVTARLPVELGITRAAIALPSKGCCTCVICERAHEKSGEMGLRGGGDRFGMLQTKLVSRASVQVDQDVFDRSCWPFCPLAH